MTSWYLILLVGENLRCHNSQRLQWFDITPDWVCEVISPATANYDRGAKRDIYAREGIDYYWIVDPIERLVEVFVLSA